MRERMAQHRTNPACSSCHQLMDPIGLSFEHFDATGRWRIKVKETFGGEDMSGKSVLNSIILLLLLLTTNERALAGIQSQATTGTIEGTLSDQTGAVLPDVNINLKNV